MSESVDLKNNDKVIYLLQSVEWSRLCWNLIWEEKIKLDNLLPEVGCVYPVTLQWNEGIKKTSTVKFLWRPPHSELNTWQDRPSEILKSYVLQGELCKVKPDNEDLHYNFCVTKVTKFLDITKSVISSDVFHFPTCGLPNGSSFMLWEEVRNCTISRFGTLIYLHGTANETAYEAIIEIKNEDYFLIFHVYEHPPFDCETIITCKKLVGHDLKVMKSVMDGAQVIFEKNTVDLNLDEVQGALYY